MKMWTCLFMFNYSPSSFGDGEGIINSGISGRFIFRRGRPRLIICDNAPQFRLVKSTMDHLWFRLLKSNELSSFFSPVRVFSGISQQL